MADELRDSRTVVEQAIDRMLADPRKSEQLKDNLREILRRIEAIRTER